MAEMNKAQKAQLFAMSTRQNMHTLARETSGTAPSTLQFNLPKNRLLSSLMVTVKFNLNIKHATKTVLNAIVGNNPLWHYKFLRRVALDLNNGFSPFVVSGEELALYNKLDVHGESYQDLLCDYNRNLEVSPNGTDNPITLCFSLPCTLNERDPIGLILLQSEQTNVTLTLDTANPSELFQSANAEDIDGFTFDVNNIKADVLTTTYSIPVNAHAYPDLSVLKLVNGRSDAMPSAGQQVIKLSTGTIYRKLLFKITDENNQPVDNDFITSNFELVFNQADVNYSISPEMLEILNTKLLGYPLPTGVYCFDFSNAGSFVNLGGTRDYIDSANLTEFWLRFNTKGKGKIHIITECLARLQANA